MPNDTILPDHRLVFLISQPRSGSSLLQQLLHAHPRIATLPEPWFLLPLIYTRKYPGVEAEYNSPYAHACLHEFLGRLDGGLAHYNECLRDCALRIYGKALGDSAPGQRFLDKTPRYYHIAADLLEMFPKAKFLFLLRNPLAVFGSILSYNFQGDFAQMLGAADRLGDLFTAPRNLARIREQTPANALFLRYEDLVTDAEEQLEAVYRHLELEAPARPAEYGVSEEFRDTTSVDTKSIAKHDKPVEHYLESWKQNIDDAQKKSLAREYLDRLGPELMAALGYSHADTVAALEAHEVRRTRVRIPFALLEGRCAKQRFLERWRVRLLLGYYRYGLRGLFRV